MIAKTRTIVDAAPSATRRRPAMSSGRRKRRVEGRPLAAGPAYARTTRPQARPHRATPPRARAAAWSPAPGPRRRDQASRALTEQAPAANPSTTSHRAAGVAPVQLLPNMERLVAPNTVIDDQHGDAGRSSGRGPGHQQEQQPASISRPDSDRRLRRGTWPTAGAPSPTHAGGALAP